MVVFLRLEERYWKFIGFSGEVEIGARRVEEYGRGKEYIVVSLF